MPCIDEIHKDDVGTELIVSLSTCVSGVETQLDISQATSKKIIIVKPDGTRTEYDAVFTSVSSGGTGDGTDGKMSYVTVAGDLDQSGKYKIQGKVILPTGTWFSSISDFRVHPNI